MPESEWLIADEVAALLRVSVATARTWPHRPPTDDRPRPIKVGKRWLWNRAELESWLDAQAEARSVAS